ncbi:LptF/LptG family permease [Devosia sp.]|uniref:LptF/LptG family permease n=1 Tax=Devosia sp. TaxID=1871048 RepID=UPI003A8F9530
MTRIDWLIVRRLSGSVVVAVVVLFGLVALVEALNTGRYDALNAVGGPPMALLGIVAASARWVLDTLPLTVLVGVIIGLLNLQTSSEMTVIKASGRSVWRLMRLPVLVVLLAGIVVAAVVDTATVELNRSLFPSSEGRSTRALWLEERRAGLDYILQAESALPGGATLNGVTIFVLDDPRDRIEAETARLETGFWVMDSATRYRSNAAPAALTAFRVPTSTTFGDMRTELASVKDMTVFELARTVALKLNNPTLRNASLTRFVQLLGLPLTLVGSVVIAFAFTAGYRRTHKYGGAVLSGIVLGFVVYVVSEMAARAGTAGALPPFVAVVAPAFVAIVSGATVLLFREDGRR